MQSARRCTTGAVLIAVLIVLTGACSGSDSDGASGDTATTAASTTNSNSDFASAVAAVSEQADSAGGDTCALLQVLSGKGSTQLPQPKTPVQVEAAVKLQAQLYTAIADAAPANYSTEAESIRTAMTAFQATAEQQNYDTTWFNSDQVDPFASAEANAALTTLYGAATESCTPGTSTTAAG